MVHIIRFLLPAFFFSFIPGPSICQIIMLTKDQSTLSSAENKFAAMAMSENIKSAFLKVLDERSVVFRPNPVNGRWAYLADQRSDSTYLFWQPEFIDVSIGGDFGYSTGPWYARKSKFTEEGRKGFGNFVTIWVKNKKGEWKVLLDKGINYSNAGERKVTLTGSLLDKNIASKEIDIAHILEMDSKAYGGYETTYFTTSSYLMQHKKWPFRNSSDSLINEFKNYDKWEPVNGAVAPSGDMAFTYGKFNGFINGSKKEGYYLRIWKRNGNDEWKIMLDLRTEN